MYYWIKSYSKRWSCISKSLPTAFKAGLFSVEFPFGGVLNFDVSRKGEPGVVKVRQGVAMGCGPSKGKVGMEEPWHFLDRVDDRVEEQFLDQTTHPSTGARKAHCSCKPW